MFYNLYVIKRFRSDERVWFQSKSHEVRRTEWDLGWNLTRLSLNTTRLKLNTTSIASGIQLQPSGIQTQPSEISTKSTEGLRLKATREIWHPNWTRAGEGRLRPRPEGCVGYFTRDDFRVRYRQVTVLILRDFLCKPANIACTMLGYKISGF